MTLFKKFPREFGLRRRVVYDIKEFLKLINLYNGKINCYTSVYSFTDTMGEVNYNSAIIDKLFFDFDKQYSDCFYEEMLRLHSYCEDRNISHSVIFSGEGFHIYILTGNNNLTNKKNTVYNAQTDLIKKLNLHIDTHVVGDISRLTRIPNTFNLKGRFCIPLKHKQIHFPYSDILKLAQKQGNCIEVIGNKLLDISRFDTRLANSNIEIQDAADIKLYGDIFGVPVEEFDDCIKHILLKENPTHLERFALVVYLSGLYRLGKNINHMDKQTKSLLKKSIYLFIKQLKWRDFNPSVTKYQIRNIVNKYNYCTCAWLKSKGICVGCDKYKEEK